MFPWKNEMSKFVNYGFIGETLNCRSLLILNIFYETMKYLK